MIAVLLCAGYATRLYPLTQNFPKPLLPVADRPVIDYLVDQIGELPQIDALHIVTNDKFYTHFSRWAAERDMPGIASISITVHNDGTSCNADRLGAVADLHFVLKSMETTQPMLVSAADNIFRFSIKEIWQRFLSTSHHLVIALPQTDLGKLQKTGVLELSDQDRVLRLHEKPTDPPSTWSCPPLYFLQPSAGKHLQTLMASEIAPDAPGHFIDYLCQHETVMAQKVMGSRLDIGDAASYREADQLLHREPVLISGDSI
jgi:glucose-1-phosphate thymidylyltransferase